MSELPSYNDVIVDWAGRTVVSQLQAYGAQKLEGKVATSYFGDYTKVTPAVGTPIETYTDVYGQVSQVVEHDSSSAYTTTYGYTGTGDLDKITDTRGNNTLYTYDWAGQRTAVDDPDAGKSTTTYDNNGQVETVTSNIATDTSNNPKTVLTYGYDNLGRQTSVVSGADQLAAWTWDDPQVPSSKGHITQSVSRDSDGNTYTVKSGGFDKRGRPTTSTVTLPSNVNGLAGSYTTTVGYDAADHITSTTYPLRAVSTRKRSPPRTTTTGSPTASRPPWAAASTWTAPPTTLTGVSSSATTARRSAAPASTPNAATATTTATAPAGCSPSRPPPASTSSSPSSRRTRTSTTCPASSPSCASRPVAR